MFDAQDEICKEWKSITEAWIETYCENCGCEISSNEELCEDCKEEMRKEEI